MTIENAPRPPAAALIRTGYFATLFSEGIEETPPPYRPARTGGLARAAAALLAQSVRTLLAPMRAPALSRPALPRPALARVQVRARSAT